MSTIKTILYSLTVLLFQLFNSFSAQAQVTPYGQIDIEDLKLKECPFEKDASAMVLFNEGNLYYNSDGLPSIEVHKRIKIFTEKSLNQANVTLPLYDSYYRESITDLKAETYNIVNDKIEITKLASNQTYTKLADKYRKSITFTLANVKAGSVIEYSYKFNTHWFSRISDWIFQESIPVRYSQFQTTLPKSFSLKMILHTDKTLIKDMRVEERNNGNTYIHETKAIENIPSFKLEPLMSSISDNLQRAEFVRFVYKPLADFKTDSTHAWAHIASSVAYMNALFDLKNIRLKNDDEIILKAKKIDDKQKEIDFIFNEVKNKLSWNNVDNWESDNNVIDAWVQKSGTSTEINVILYYFLKKLNIECYPVLVSTKSNGKVNPGYPYLEQFNRVVIEALPDSASVYLLDASEKSNLYNEVPLNLLNSYGLNLNTKPGSSGLIYIENGIPVREVIYVKADISNSGLLNGVAQFVSNSYNKDLYTKLHSKLNSKDYEALFASASNLKITNLSFGAASADSASLVQNINFTAELTDTGDKYLFLKPSLFSNSNPFINTTRNTDIDFGFTTYTTISCDYKLPTGYKLATTPPNISMNMPDKSINFKRLTFYNNNVLTVRYFITFTQSYFPKEAYLSVYDFYKKMYQYINEQVVLEKI